MLSSSKLLYRHGCEKLIIMAVMAFGWFRAWNFKFGKSPSHFLAKSDRWNNYFKNGPEGKLKNSSKDTFSICLASLTLGKLLPQSRLL